MLFRLNKSELTLLTLIVMATVALFSPVLFHDFIGFDDDVFVFENRYIAGGLSFDVIKWAFTAGHEANWIPFSLISHAIDITLFGLNPSGHHAVNLLLHSANSALLFILLFKSTGDKVKSAIVALLFAVHPLHIESVAWVAERKDVLSTFFGFLMLWQYVRYSKKPDIKGYIATVFLFICALLSKPMIVTFPLLMLLLDWWPLGRCRYLKNNENYTDNVSLYRLMLEKIPFFLLSSVSSWITYSVQKQFGEVSQGYTLLSRTGKAFISYVTYLYKMVLPIDLAILYPFPKYPPSTFLILSAFIAVTFISSLAIFYAVKYPYFFTGWFWYLLALLPVIGIIQIGQHTVADRYTYNPLNGIFICVVWGGAEIFSRYQIPRRVVAGFVTIILLILGIITTNQLKQWQNSITLFSHTINVTEDNWVILSSLGLEYLDKGRIAEAKELFSRSISAKPTYALAYLNMGAAYIDSAEYVKAEEYYRKALQFNQYNPKAYCGLGIAIAGNGRYEEAIEVYYTLNQMNPELADRLLVSIKKLKSGRNPLTDVKN